MISMHMPVERNAVEGRYIDFSIAREGPKNFV